MYVKRLEETAKIPGRYYLLNSPYRNIKINRGYKRARKINPKKQEAIPLKDMLCMHQKKDTMIFRDERARYTHDFTLHAIQ